MKTPTRVKIFTVNEIDVADWFQILMGIGKHHYVKVPIAGGVVPRDGLLLSVNHNRYKRQFEFMVEHASFDVVAAGEACPIENLVDIWADAPYAIAIHDG